MANDKNGLYLGYFQLQPPKANFEIRHIVATYGPSSRRLGTLRLDQETIDEEDPFSHANENCVMDHRENKIILVLPDKVRLLDVDGDRIRTAAEFENPFGVPARVRIHR